MARRKHTDSDSKIVKRRSKIPRLQDPTPESDPGRYVPSPESDPGRYVPSPESDPGRYVPSPESDPGRYVPSPESDPGRNVPSPESDPSRNVASPESNPVRYRASPDDRNVEPKSLLHLCMDLAATNRLWSLSRFRFIFNEASLVLTQICLHPNVSRWIRIVLQKVCYRVHRGIPVRSLTLHELKMDDSYVQLPPTIQQETVCVIENPAEKLISLFVELFNLSDGRVESKEKDHFFMCLKYLLQRHINADQKKWFPKVQTLPFHFFLQSSTWKLIFIKYLVRFLKHNTDLVQEILNTNCWQRLYNKQHCGGMSYDIVSAIRENAIFVEVYNFGATKEINLQPYGEEQNGWEQIGEQNGRGQPAGARYQNTGVGVITFIGNIIFHANDHRKKMLLLPWTDEELEALIEHSFPGEMLHAFTFFWLAGLPIDYGKSLYVEEGESQLN